MGLIEKSEDEGDTGWAAVELSRADFGDTRLNRRIVKVAEALSARPQGPINQAHDDWAATKAAYRLFSNEKVKERELFGLHQDRTCQRAQSEEVVLAIQDTTYLNYGNHKKCKGLGYIGEVGASQVKGVILHHTLAVSPKGVPLGLVTQRKTTRMEMQRLQKRDRQRLPSRRERKFSMAGSLTGHGQVATERAARGHRVRSRRGYL